MANENILIVDDDEDVLDLCQRILEAQGYNTTTSQNVYEAIEFAQTMDFDLLLTDIKMPEMDGLELAKVIKDADPGMICVTMTGYSTMDTAIEAVKLGIDEYVLKPFTPGELNVAVTKALEKKRLRKENYRLNSLMPLFQLNKTLMSAGDIDTVLNRLREIAQNETKTFLSALFYLTENNNITSRFHRTDDEDYNENQKKVCNTLAATVFENGDLSIFNLNSNDEEQQGLNGQLKSTSVIAAPIKSQNSTIAVLILAHKEFYFTPSDIEFLSILCGQASIALENARLFSETQESYQKLHVPDHMKSELTNIAAHELRTPLAILMGYTTLIDNEENNVDKKVISSILRNAKRLRSLINDMLNLQYLESGIPLLHHNKLDISEAVHEITQDMSLLAQEKQIDISIDIPGNFPEMIIDRQKFDLILVNIFDNAIKFSPAGSKISFKATASENYAAMFINNTGTIIAPEELEKIFKRFYQVEDSVSRAHDGAGLGLAIAQGMTKVCGGEISVESNEEKGTTFSVTIPLNNMDHVAQKMEL